MTQTIVQEEFMSKLQKALEDDAFVADLETRDATKVKNALGAKGIELSDDEIAQFLKAADDDAELSLENLDNVAGGGFVTGAVIIGCGAAFCWGYIKQRNRKKC